MRHKIRCGDAMHFQGKEADIVFVSLVDAGERIRATSGRMFEQRFNVGCSRARDRMYLYHSFTRDQLRENDLKAQLLDHFSQPMPRQEAAGDLRSVCESPFEKQVFDELTARGYRVVPQVRTGGYRIDLVVESPNDARLAIECDGDRFHGPERWMEDIGRQRTLERMGWQFWRCWGSSWYADRSSCLDDLFERMGEVGVQRWPEDAENQCPSMLVESREISPEPTAHEPETGGWDELPDEEDTSDEDRPELPLTSPVNEAPLRSASLLAIEVGDEVVYRLASDPDDRRRARIVTGASQPSLGTINQRTPLAEALLGCVAGEEVEAALPTGLERLLVIEVIRGS